MKPNEYLIDQSTNWEWKRWKMKNEKSTLANDDVGNWRLACFDRWLIDRWWHIFTVYWHLDW